MALLAIAVMPAQALGKNCSAQGGLAYLGITSNQSRSVWLSSTTPGSFSLQAAQGNTTVDQWTPGRRGLHVTLSPVVSNGNGGVHKLLDSTGCQLDTQNQKGGITFPPSITLPPSLPPILKPPTGITPGMPTMPGIPGMPSRPPVGITPQLPTRPPGGFAPELPGGVRPPIGTLPPGGITPELPGGVTPPIGTLPPTGITPELPTRPPGGITPELPGGVRPPIGTLPPGGITPELPGGVTPPIATLPPTGITPELPTRPPGGITPELPGGVRPPIGTLPPGGITPELPGGVMPPIGTLPPPTEVMQPVEGRALARATPPVGCPGGIDENGQLLDCVDRRPAPDAATGGFGSTVPITPGREFAEPSLWNTWADARYIGSTDHRYGLDNKGRGNYLTLGADRRISNDFVAGVSLSVEDNSSTGFGGASQVDSNGVNIGPYIGMRLSDSWAMDASLGFGMIDNDNQIAVLNGRYTAQRYSAAVNLTGHYAFGETQWRPRVSVSYTHLRNEAYQMSGIVIGTPVTLQVAENKFDYGVTEATIEVNKVIPLSAGKFVVPYAEFGARYEFERPNGGQMLAFDLSLATPSAWTGTLRLGVRALVTRATFFEAGLGYLSIGQKGLDVMEAKLYLSHAF